MYLNAPFRTRYRYTDLFHLGIAYNTDARRVLYVGLGAGSSEKRLWRDFPRAQIQAVELDPVVVDVAYRYFHLPRDPRLRVSVGDGRRYLADDEQRFDVIVIDAFFADAIPAHLVTQEFLRLVRTRLAPGGVVVTNAIGAISGPGSRLFRSIYKTYRTVFPSVLVHPAILRGRPRRRPVPQPDHRRDRESRAWTCAARRSLGRDSRARPIRARSTEADSRPPRHRDPDRRRTGVDGRLRPDRRAPAPLPVGLA